MRHDPQRFEPQRPQAPHGFCVAAGTTIGRYSVRTALGYQVFEATDPNLDRTIAIKLFRTERSADDARVLRDGGALSRVAHPNVAAVYDVGVWRGGLFLAMERVDGRDVRAWARDRSWRDAVRVFAAAARGLAATHDVGLSHRDIRLEHLVVDDAGQVRLVGFGLAAADEDDSARSDQRAFCTTMSEVLEWTRRPSWLRGAIARGLHPDPDKRHADLRALARALERGLGARRRGAVAAVLVAASVAIAALQLRTEADACAASDRMADVWDDTVRGDIARSFHASGRPYAAFTLARVEAALDAYASAWGAMRTDACESTRRGDQPPELVDLRTSCLDRARAEFVAVVTGLRRADAQLVDRAIAATASLTDLRRCVDVAELTALIALPADPVARAEVGVLRTDLAEVKVAVQNGHYLHAKQRVDAIAARIGALAYPPLTAEWLLHRATVELLRSNAAGAGALYRSAALEAEAAGDDRSKAKALTGHALVVGTLVGDRPAAEQLVSRTRAVMARIGNPADLEASLEDAIATMSLHHANITDALAHYRRASAAADRAFGAGDVRSLLEQLNVVSALERAGEYEPALALGTAAVGSLERVLGVGHPTVAQGRTIVAGVLYRQARYDDSLREFRAAIDVLRRTFGPRHVNVLSAQNGIAMVLEATHDSDAALAAYEDALEIAVSSYGPEHVSVALQRINLGNTLLALERYAEARQSFARAIEIVERAVGHENELVAGALGSTGEVLRLQGKPRSALQPLEEGLRIYRAVAGPEHPAVGSLLGNLGRTYLALGDSARAIRLLEESLRIYSKAFGETHPRSARTSIALASALVGRDRARARHLVERARDVFATANDVPEREEAEAWLSAHR